MTKAQRILLRSFILTIGLLVAGLSVFWLPDLSKSTASANPGYEYLRWPILIWLLSSTVPFYYALFVSNRLLNFIQQKRAFTHDSVNALSKISKCALFIAINYCAGTVILVVMKSISAGIFLAVTAVIFSSFTISFFAKLLQSLLFEALQYKDEVDLTI